MYVSFFVMKRWRCEGKVKRRRIKVLIAHFPLIKQKIYTLFVLTKIIMDDIDDIDEESFVENDMDSDYEEDIEDSSIINFS